MNGHVLLEMLMYPTIVAAVVLDSTNVGIPWNSTNVLCFTANIPTTNAQQQTLVFAEINRNDG